MTEKQSALRRLQQADFVLAEAGLYLTGYPCCAEALRYFEEAKRSAAAARCAYEEAYGPLTLSSAGGTGCFNWNDDPLPWEWEAN